MGRCTDRSSVRKPGEGRCGDGVQAFQVGRAPPIDSSSGCLLGFPPLTQELSAFPQSARRDPSYPGDGVCRVSHSETVRAS